MVKKTPTKVKHVPQRTCVGCRKVLPKRSLIRIVRTENGVEIDLSGKAAGRGAYLHNLQSCWKQALKGNLARALKTEITRENITLLQAYMETIPDETAEE